MIYSAFTDDAKLAIVLGKYYLLFLNMYMKKILLIGLLAGLCPPDSRATIWTISNSGDAFSPATVSIAEGDTLVFDIENMHDAVEVSEATYNANGNTPLSNGFSVPFGGGTVLPAKLTAGRHWFVCSPHAQIGMKGIINVGAPTAITEVWVSTPVTLSPNPAPDYITIESASSLEGTGYLLVDAQGRMVAKGKLRDKATRIDVHALAAGNYFVQLGNGIVRRTLKVVKQ